MVHVQRTEETGKAGFTPGPWKVNAVHAYGEGWIYVESASDGVCSIAVDGDKDARLADARLIAAAPDLLAQRDALLAACKATYEAFGLDSTLPIGFPVELADMLRSTIAKAESGTGTPATPQPTESPAAQHDVLGMLTPRQTCDLACDIRSTPELLDILSKHRDASVRYAVAKHPSAYDKTLAALAHDEYQDVSERALRTLAARGGAA